MDGNHTSLVPLVEVDLESCGALALLIFFKYLSVSPCLSVCLSVFDVHWCFVCMYECVRSSGTGFTDVCEMLCRC